MASLMFRTQRQQLQHGRLLVGHPRRRTLHRQLAQRRQRRHLVGLAWSQLQHLIAVTGRQRLQALVA